MVLVRLFALLFLFSTSAWGEGARSTHGEIQTPEFYGSHLSDFKFNPYLFRLSLNEERFRNNYVEDHINDEFFKLSGFMSEELYLGLSCPDDSFLEKYDYIRFLNRLQTMSYLFQSLREHEYTMRRLNIKNTCEVDWSKIMETCSPKTSEMKLFVENSSSVFKSLSKINTPFEKDLSSIQEQWFSDIKNGKSQSITGVQLTEYCKKNNCKTLNLESISKIIKPMCEQELNMFESLCSENDSLYGLSQIPEAYQLIISSSGLRGIDKDGLAAGCVKRFALQNKNLEKEVSFLKTLFEVLFEFNLEETPQNPQGKLYTMGALREFTEKGLENVFQLERKSVSKREVVKVKEVQPEPTFEEIVLPKFVKKKREKNREVPKILKAEVPNKVRKSSFLISCEVRQQFKLDVVNIDMEKFSRDYVFTIGEKEKLLPVVKQFSSVKALRSMKRLDKLGSKFGPIPLKFLKFLIDEKMNQNLFNIILVLGNSFYVQNDIDPGNLDPVYIDLRFDSSKPLLWEMKVLAPL